MIIKECLDGFGLGVLFIFDVTTLEPGFKMAISASLVLTLLTYLFITKIIMNTGTV